MILNHRLITKCFLILMVMLTSTSIAQAQQLIASGANMTETRSVSTFTSLEVSSAIDVIYTVGSQTKVTVTAPQSIMKYVHTDVKGYKLKCFLMTNDYSGINLDGRKVVINITAPTISEYDLSGASYVKVTNAVDKLPKLEIDLSGSSKMEFGSVQCTKMEIDMSGASNLDIKSLSCTSQDIDVSGASKIYIDKIKASKLELDASGASHGEISGEVGFCEIEISGASSYDLSGLIFKNGDVEVTGASSLTINKKSGIDRLESTGSSTVKKK